MARNDAEILRAARDGDATVFAELMARHTARTYRFAVSVLGDATEAEDVTQETFIEAFRCAGRFNGTASAGPWLLGIASNRCRTRERQRRGRDISLDALADAGDVGDGDAQPNSPIDRQRQHLRIDTWQAVAELPLKHRLPIILRFQHGLSCGDIAEALGISATAVAARLHRARAMLRRRLRHLAEGGEDA